MSDGTALRPFQPASDPGERSIAQRLRGVARPDLALIALRNALYREQPGAIAPRVVIDLLSTYGLGHDEARPVTEKGSSGFGVG